MMDRLAVALAQLNPHVGQVEKNLSGIVAARAEAARQGADLVVTPELSIAGYPADDLLSKRAFIEACRGAVERLAQVTGDGGPGMVVGAPWAEDGVLYNAALLLERCPLPSSSKRAREKTPNAWTGGAGPRPKCRETRSSSALQFPLLDADP